LMEPRGARDLAGNLLAGVLSSAAG